VPPTKSGYKYSTFLFLSIVQIITLAITKPAVSKLYAPARYTKHPRQNAVKIYALMQTSVCWYENQISTNTDGVGSNEIIARAWPVSPSFLRVPIAALFYMVWRRVCAT